MIIKASLQHLGNVMSDRIKLGVILMFNIMLALYIMVFELSHESVMAIIAGVAFVSAINGYVTFHRISLTLNEKGSLREVIILLALWSLMAVAFLLFVEYKSLETDATPVPPQACEVIDMDEETNQ